MRRVGGVIGDIFVQMSANLHKELEIDTNQLQVRDVLMTAIPVNMRSLSHELSEEVHPSLQIDMPTTVIRPWEVVHPRGERSPHLMDAIMPAKQKHVSIFLGVQEPLIPLLYLLPILLRKSTGV